MSIDDKNKTIDQYKNDQCKARVLLITLTAGGVGLNLYFANHVIIMDSWWNPATEEQAIDRVYRIGQRKTVEVHRLYMRDTIEEWLIRMKDEKKLVDQQWNENDRIYQPDKRLLAKLLRRYICIDPEELEDDQNEDELDNLDDEDAV